MNPSIIVQMVEWPYTCITQVLNEIHCIMLMEEESIQNVSTLDGSNAGSDHQLLRAELDKEQSSPCAQKQANSFRS